MADNTKRLQPELDATLDDGELLGVLKWRKSANRRLVEHASDANLAAFASALRRSSRIGRKLRSSDRGTDSCDVFLQPLWSLKAFSATGGEELLAGLLRALARTDANPGRKQVSRNSRRTRSVLEATAGNGSANPIVHLGWLTILAWGGSLIDDEALAQLWLTALRETIRGSESSGGPDPSLTDDQELLIEGELPFLAGLIFQDLRGFRGLTRRGQQALRDGLEIGTDGDGTPHARLLERFSLWLSPFCRSSAAGRRFEQPWWNRTSSARFSDLVFRSSALTRSSGEFALGNGVALAPASLLKACTREVDTDRPSRSFVQSVSNDVHLLRQRKPINRNRRGKPTPAARRRPFRVKRSDRPASQSDWAQLACLRNNWDLGADACIIAYDTEQPRIDLTALGTTVISGNWGAQSTVNGVPLDPGADWQCVCWFSDVDVDYVELQRDDGDATVLRQAMLSRTDHFLYLADSLVSQSQSTIDLEHRFELPLADGAVVTRDALTREHLLEIGALKVRVLPVSLEQAATTAAAGEVSVHEDVLSLRQRAAGTGLLSSLVLDWSPVRRKTGALWRSVTVAEDGRIVGASEASGIHLRIGSHQWLFYRSLSPGKTARTVLGQHDSNETTIGELTSDGNLEPLIIVEGGSDTEAE